MLTKKQLKILGPMAKNLHREYAYKELKKLSGENSDNGFQIAISAFKEEKLITERRVGTSLLLRPNLGNDVIYSYISIINLGKLPKMALEAVQLLKNEIEKYTQFYSLVVFGSYADNTQTKASDIDIAIFTENNKKENDTGIKP